LALSERFAGWAVLGCHNGGEPIPPLELAAMFDRYRQVRGRRGGRRSGGTGLGLAICQSIVDAHSGAMFAESSAKGTSLWVALPVGGPEAPSESKTGSLGPVWLDCGEPDADRIAAAAILTRRGLSVRLLPVEAEAAASSRRAVGSGLVVSLGRAALAPPGANVAVLFDAEPTLETIGSALARLASRGAPMIPLASAPGPALVSVLEALGLQTAQPADGEASILLDQTSATAGAVIDLAAQLEPRARRIAPVRALHHRARRQEEALAILRIRHLDAFNATYGARRAALLRRALEDLARAAAVEDRVEILALEDGVLVTGSETVVERVATEAEKRFRSLARLNYRKQDREQGFVRIGETDVPLADLDVQTMSATVSEEELFDAIGQ